MSEWTTEWMKWVYECMNEWTNELSEWTGEWSDWMNEGVIKWAKRRKKKGMEECTTEDELKEGMNDGKKAWK